MFAGLGSAFVVTTRASKRELMCFADVMCRPNPSLSGVWLSVVDVTAANAGAATRPTAVAIRANSRLRRTRLPSTSHWPTPADRQAVSTSRMAGQAAANPGCNRNPATSSTSTQWTPSLSAERAATATRAGKVARNVV